jgi:hypothetical protein
VNSIEGPVVTLAVGSAASRVHYTLPVKLLSTHSVFFTIEIKRLLRSSAVANKKRKVSPVPGSDDTTTTTAAVTATVAVEGEVHELAPREPDIDLPDMDPFIFGMFLTYMYTGAYPNLDSPHASKPRDAITPSIHAWLLAHRLGATPFMNYAMRHIHHGLGRFFTLTPDLMEYIWANTATAVLAATGPVPALSALDVLYTASDINPSPLRRFVFDVLSVYWTAPVSLILAKAPAMDASWGLVFDAHPDLRRHFIMGLQNGGRVGQVHEYLVAAGGAPKDSVAVAAAKKTRAEKKIAAKEAVAKHIVATESAAAEVAVDGAAPPEEPVDTAAVRDERDGALSEEIPVVKIE